MCVGGQVGMASKVPWVGGSGGWLVGGEGYSRGLIGERTVGTG